MALDLLPDFFANRFFLRFSSFISFCLVLVVGHVRRPKLASSLFNIFDAR